jgi:hypothetical protein
MNCGVPRAYLWALICYMVSNIILFGNFYHKTYITKGKKQQVNGTHSNGHAQLKKD